MGNILNKEWIQQEDMLSSDEQQPQQQDQDEKNPESKSKLIKRKISNLVANSNCGNAGEYTRVNGNDSTPIANKVLVANFDPRSPTNGIVR